MDNQIENIVTKYFGLPVVALDYKTRKREIVQARQITMYFYKEFTKLSLATIGSKIGGKDHATVLHARKTVNNLIDTDVRYRKDIENLQKIIEVHMKNENQPTNVFRIGDMVWIIVDGKYIEVKIVNYDLRSLQWICSKIIDGREVSRYNVDRESMWYIRPDLLYNVVFVDKESEINFDFTRIAQNKFCAFIEWDAFSIVKIQSIINSMKLVVVDYNMIAWNDGESNRCFMMVTPEYIGIKPNPRVVQSKSIYQLINTMANIGGNKIVTISTQIDNVDCFTRSNNNIQHIRYGNKAEVV